MSQTESLLKTLMERAIATIEELEQQTIAISNQSISESEHQRVLNELQALSKNATIIEVERNTLSQVVRIFASRGEVDPTAEALNHPK